MKRTQLSSVSRSHRTLLAALCVAVVAGFPGTAQAVSKADCLTVEVADRVALPDGSLLPAGALTLCLSRALSPVARLHEVSLNGIPVGLLLSRVGLSEGASDGKPVVMFQRDRRGWLQLLGYAWPGGTTSRTYMLAEPSSRAGIGGRRRPRPAIEEDVATIPISVAARAGHP